ncbi:MAG: hypothetical protein SH847_11300, partial [Roseiflexaceae bacterium]|nr:hypothetical protein [Roseiflexaceae bacterium]
AGSTPCRIDPLPDQPLAGSTPCRIDPLPDRPLAAGFSLRMEGHLFFSPIMFSIFINLQRHF